MTTEGMTLVVGVRTADEVFAALEELSTCRRPWTAFEQGLLHAYRWAVGTRALAPVTGDEAMGLPGPCRSQLLAECQAAEVRIRTGVDPGPDADAVLGTYTALAWVCGHHDERP
ncbi:hypothetical protein KNE206_60930 [Kitasatospora sp. NE20-6]|uniref:hypothetical protein n=1 Tax=Kitasatospora sp. NE20-6 TaxID=2859066 RepID=UPI0034DCADFD